MIEKEMTCIVCPQGCRLLVKFDEETKDIEVTNHLCKRGPEYAFKEMTNPTRFLTATIKIEHSHHRRLPIKSSQEIPKEKIFEIMDFLKTIVVSAPIENGEVVVKNILNLGIDLIATRDMYLI